MIKNNCNNLKKLIIKKIKKEKNILKIKNIKITKYLNLENKEINLKNKITIIYGKIEC